jgi:tetratricopeptide (TPR) repeat protein
MGDRRTLRIGGLARAAERWPVLALVLVAMVWAVYWNSLDSPFLFDDWHVIPQNPGVRAPDDVPSFFVDVSRFSVLPGNRDYRPVFLTSMALCWWAGGGSTLPFHVVSIALHTAAVLLIFLIVRLTLGSGDRSPSVPESHRTGTAFLAASLFAVHPLATESVNYISTQSVQLAASFYLLSFFLFLRVHGSQVPRWKPARWLLALGSYSAYAAALLSKPIAITLPLNLILWELLLGAAPSRSGESTRFTWKGAVRRLWKILPYVIVSVAYLALRRIVLSAAVGGGEPVRSVLSHYLTQTRALVFYYLGSVLAPVGLNADREYAVSSSVADPQFLAALAILGAIAWLLFRLRRHRILVFWSLWFPTCLLVTTYAVVLGQLVNEHRVYLSLAGACVVAGIAFLGLWRALPIRVSDLTVGIRSGRFLSTSIAVVVLLSFAAATRARNTVWSSELSLWENAAERGGTWRAHMNYGQALEAAGRPEEALRELKKAVELGPYAFAHLNLGLAYVKRNDLETGLDHLQTAVRLWPSSAETHLYLGYGLEKAGRLEEAENEMKQAVALRPNYLRGHRYLAEFHERRGQVREALQSYDALLDLERSQPAYLLFQVGFLHQKHGRRERAIALYERLLRVAPDHRQGTFNLAYAYLHGLTPDDWSRSATLFQRVLEIDPDYSEAIFRLASAHWKLGNQEEARESDRLYLEKGAHQELRRRSQQRLASQAGGSRRGSPQESP